MLHLDNRMSLRYWPSLLLARSLYDWLPVKLLYIFNDLLFSYFAIYVAIYIGMTAVSYMVLAKIWMKMLIQNINGNISFTLAIGMFKEQLVFNKLANSVLAEHILPAILVGGAFVFGSLLVALIAGSRTLPVSISLNFALASVIIICSQRFIIFVGAQLCELSGLLKRNLLTRGGRIPSRYELKILKSCSQVRIYMGTHFYFGSSTYVSYLEVIKENTISFILLVS